MNREIDEAAQSEIAGLVARLGPTLTVDATIPDFRVGTWRPLGSEVCMVIRRPGGKLLTMIKTFYPRGAHRLPTGGIDPGEPILDAALRETHEETGLDVDVRRLLCHIVYRRDRGTAPVFHTFAFLLLERGGTLGSLDPHEQLEEFREVEGSELPAIAARLEQIDGETATEPGDWPAWGRFRAVVHRAVHAALGG
jgi:8-oxo-dGTP pyrophosphatase MutT (NUDIX family)